MEGNLVTLDIGDSWIMIINSISKNNHLIGMLIQGQLLLRYPKMEIILQTNVVVNHMFRKKKRRGSLNCVEEEKYIFHIALLGGPCIVSQS